MKLKTITIKKIASQKKTSKRTGKDYTSVGIVAEELDGSEKFSSWINGFGNKITSEWSEGDVLKVGKDVMVEKATDKEGNTIKNKEGQIYLNFKTPSRLDQLEKRVEYLEKETEKLIEFGMVNESRK